MEKKDTNTYYEKIDRVGKTLNLNSIKVLPTYTFWKMGWFPYDKVLHYERVKLELLKSVNKST